MKARVPARDSIRVNTGVKKIEVNDEGETITLNFADQSFAPRYFAMLDDFQEKSGEFEAEAKALDEAEYETPMDRARAASAFSLKVHLSFKERIDQLFGADTCRKVFGDIVPAADLYMDFIEKLAPYFEKYGKERQSQLKKRYNAARKGNV